VTTVFLSLLPLVMIGTAVWWFWRRMRQLEREETPALSHAPPRL